MSKKQLCLTWLSLPALAQNVPQSEKPDKSQTNHGTGVYKKRKGKVRWKKQIQNLVHKQPQSNGSRM